jgi:hypothetical protein
MAITVNSIPEEYASLHDELWFVVDSTNKASTNFKYVFDVYVDATLIARIKQFPDVSSTKGIFNAGNIMRNYAQSNFIPNTATTLFSASNDNIYKEFTIKYGEEYGGTTYTNLLEQTYVAFNFYYPDFYNPAQSPTYFKSYINKWLTNRDLSNVECAFTDKLHIGYMSPSGVTTNVYPSVQLYNENGTTSGSAVTTATDPQETFSLLDISPSGINSWYGSTVIPQSAYSYGIKLHNGVGFGDEVRVKLVCNPNYSPIALHFLNQLGGYDTMHFRLVNKESRNVESKQYEGSKFRYNASATAMRSYDDFNRINPGATKYVVEHSTMYKLRSNYLNVTDYNWLAELIQSPEVYFEQGGYYYPVVTMTSNWEEKKRIADKMFNLELDVQIANKKYSQFR